MTPQLTPELHQALAKQPGQALEVEDPITHDRYVLVQLDVFERLQRSLDYDASEPDPREFYPAFASAVKNHLDELGTDDDKDDVLRSQP
jgi:hypothetical protein